MDPADFNRKVWEATVQAQFELAGVRGFDPKTQAFLIPSGSVQNGFPGLTNQNATELANLNSQLYSLADQMQPASAVQWGPTTNRRNANYGIYLDYADPGANGNGAYQIAYTNAQTNYTNELKVWSPMKQAAQTAYQASGSNKTFDDWVHTDYFNSETYSNEESTVGQLYSAFTTAASQFYGPLWKTLNNDRSAYDLGSRAYISTDAVGYNMDCGTDGVNPAYNIDRDSWATTYKGWLSQATKNPPPKPSASATISVDSDSSTDLTEYGITTVHAQNSSFFDFPFMFWGEGAYSSVTERQSMYQSQNFNSAKITMTSLVQPVSYPINPGKWYSTDLTTAFPNLLGGAPANPGTLMYPYAATVVLAYNVGFQVTLDSTVYQSLKQTTTTDVSAETVVGFLGWIFGESSTTYNNRTTSSLSQITYDDTSNTVTINPDNNGIPTVLGVIVGKDPASLKATGPLGAVVPAAQIQPSPQETAMALLYATKAFILDLNTFFSTLTKPQRASIVSAIKKVLQPRSSDFQPLINAIEDVVSGSRFFEDDESNEIILEQFFKHSALSITVKNTSGGANKDQSEAVLKFSAEAQKLAAALDNGVSIGKTGSYVKIAQTLILRALASLARIKNPAKLNAKESLVLGLVQELTALAVSSELTALETDDTQASQPKQGLQGRPFYLQQGNLQAVVGAAQDNSTVWDSTNDAKGVNLSGGTAYRVDLIGFKEGVNATPQIRLTMNGQVTYNTGQIASQWDGAGGLQYCTFTPNADVSGEMTVRFMYDDPNTAFMAPLPTGPQPGFPDTCPTNPMQWALGYPA